MTPDAPLQAPQPNAEEVATLAGGCFWCLEAIYSDLPGVARVDSGYSGGRIPNPTYEQVCSGRTGHAEAVQVRFDPGRISYRQLLRIFFSIHDPTTLNRQGGDVGTQYRSAIFTQDGSQEKIAREVMGEISDSRMWRGRLVTEVVPLEAFYQAEEYHRDYFKRHPESAYCQMVIAPKVAKFRKQYLHEVQAQ